MTDTRFSADNAALLNLAEDYEIGLKKATASGYEEFGPDFRRRHQMVIDALKFQASALAQRQPIPDDTLAGWARNWHWNDCAEDKPVDPSIYFRDMRMLKAFRTWLAEHTSTVTSTVKNDVENTEGGAS